MMSSEPIDLVLDTYRCPISGKYMREPILMSDGLTYDATSLGLEALPKDGKEYEPAALDRWLRTHASPITGLVWTERPRVNRALQETSAELYSKAVEDETNNPTAPTILRIRLRASLMWLTQFRCHIDHELDFRLALHMFADTYPTLFTSDPPAALLPWPLVLNPLLCVRLVWHAYAQLRALVYAEFARFRGPHPELKLLAAQHFVASMLRTPNAHKTDQLLAALQTAYSLPCFHRTQPSAEWIRFWAERPPCSDSDIGRRAVAGLKAIARIEHASRSLACTPGRANPFCVWHLQPNGTSRFVRLFHSNTHYRTRYEFWRSETEGEMLQTLIDSGVMRCLDDVDAFLSNASWFLMRNRNPTPPPSEW
jgi:hypothetical protein